MTIMGVRLGRDLQTELSVNRGDSAAHRIEALRVYLEDRLGLSPFLGAYRYLKRIGEGPGADTDAAVTAQLEMLMGGAEQLTHLPALLQLIAVEERFDET
ncbi:hypothetical protein JKP88DRAFT_218539 [Tribonema minus]|uniref:Uncharacterized protein n=1 Tax=Tribonema minus TaxID=303371 RepID=A0A835Z7V8_9STRA|nr:hypothetical protein JKP88DRAFT_218539 [Tribonema minus]